MPSNVASGMIASTIEARMRLETERLYERVLAPQLRQGFSSCHGCWNCVGCGIPPGVKEAPNWSNSVLFWVGGVPETSPEQAFQPVDSGGIREAPAWTWWLRSWRVGFATDLEQYHAG